MDNRAIGFFDSGLGGLTSVRILKDRLPQEKVLYYGDTARTPYGSKSPETIRRFSRQIVAYLVEKNVKMVVIACNTVTAMALDGLRETFPELPILGVIAPTVRRVVDDGKEGVGIIGTKVTIESGVYAAQIHALDPSIETHSLACPALVPLIEEGIIDDEIMEKAIHHYMDDFVHRYGFRRLVLGCTHYPLIAASLQRLYPGLRLYNSSAEVIDEVVHILENRDMLAGPNAYPDRYYASDLSEPFLRMTDRLFEGHDTRIKLKNLED